MWGIPGPFQVTLSHRCADARGLPGLRGVAAAPLGRDPTSPARRALCGSPTVTRRAPPGSVSPPGRPGARHALVVWHHQATIYPARAGRRAPRQRRVPRGTPGSPPPRRSPPARRVHRAAPSGPLLPAGRPAAGQVPGHHAAPQPPRPRARLPPPFPRHYPGMKTYREVPAGSPPDVSSYRQLGDSCAAWYVSMSGVGCGSGC